jgi:hypothetical protein
MPSVQVYDDGLGREKPKTFVEYQERLIPIINEHYADLDIGSAMVTRGEENIRYNNLLSESIKITGYPVSDPLRLEFFRDLHFWSGIPTAEMLAWKNREVMVRMVKITWEVAKEQREKKRG